jgi:hypothetical protein
MNGRRDMKEITVGENKLTAHPNRSIERGAVRRGGKDKNERGDR